MSGPVGLADDLHGDEQPAPPPASPDATERGLRGVVRFLAVGMAGVAAMLGGLVWDLLHHLDDPLAAHEESGPLDLSNPAHVLLVVGGWLVVGGLVGATVRARGLASRPRRAPYRRIVALLAAAALVGAGAAVVSRSGDAQPQLLPADPSRAEAHAHGLVNSHAEGECRPSRADRVGALRLIADTAAGTARFADPQVALAEGYVPGAAAATRTDHWLNPWYMNDGRALDPDRPEVLVYTPTAAGPVLTGVTYIMNVAGEFGPEVGGCLTRWHVHANLCFSPVTQAVVGEVQPDGNCGPGSVRYIPPPALHVWLVDVPGGRFAPEIDHEALAAAVARR